LARPAGPIHDGSEQQLDEVIVKTALTTAVACVACLLATAAAASAAASARATCALPQGSVVALRTVSPCRGGVVARRRTITFTVYDANPRAVAEHPYLNLQTSREMAVGHLVANTDGNGVFTRLAPRRGHRDQWTVSVVAQSYTSWWDNHRGLCYVQIDQLDAASADGGIDYSPIVTLHVR
jgi:hypothetical protein